MSTDKLRERFELVFRKPKYVVWSEKHQNYGFTQRKYAYQALRYRAMYVGFKGCFDLVVSEQRQALQKAGEKA